MKSDSQEESGPSSGQKILAHSGYVAVVGKPNVGKSTLMNRILGEKIAIVSPKPQTTRLRQLGIYTKDGVQAIFVDTPGIHQPRHKLGEFMLAVARDALRDADVVVFVVDLSEAPDSEDRRVADLLAEARTGAPVILALNKIDRLSPDRLASAVELYRALSPEADWVALSATQGRGVDDLLSRVVEELPAGPQFYPEDQLSDTALRDITAEIIREKVLLNTEQEIPHAVAVEVEEFKERSDTLTYVGATIYVERDSQKGILIGKGGAMLKRISSQARVDIETLVGTKVYLELWVKVLKDWRRDEAMLRRFGYRLSR
ncbi:MAG TPA: GTPase Era [Aggregatilineales bacterium]|nr:GTPase Era [Aggregatilineales bacterium]